MKKLQGLKVYQDLPEAVQQQLPTIVEHRTYPAETTLFKEGDPPGSCYLILSGCCGVFIVSKSTYQPKLGNVERPTSAASATEEDHEVKQEEEKTEEPEETAPAETDVSEAKVHVEDDDADAPGDVEVEVQDKPLTDQEQRRTSLLSTVNDPAIVDAMMDALSTDEARPSERLSVESANVDLVPTVEGFSNVARDGSDIGVKVLSLSSGAFVGELGLMNDQPRAASVRCLENCEFLVINRDDFMSCLNAEMQRAREEKDNFLLTHLPGMRKLQSSRYDGRTQVFYLFEKKRVPVGHVFLQQGSIQEEAIYIVFDGTVEFRHNEQSKIAAGPRLRPKLSAGSRRANLKSSSGTQASDLLSHAAGLKRLGNLVSGGVFGSMPIAQVPEPFTVAVSSSSCEVFYVAQKNVTKLPRPIQESIREYLTRATTLRLQRLSHSRTADLSQSNSSPDLGKGLLQLMPKLPKKIPPPSLQKQKDVRSSSAALQTVAKAVLADTAAGGAFVG